jgi:superfamily II DNA/RNA helicase
VVSTAGTFNNLIKFARTKINPKFIVIDEADLLLEMDTGLSGIVKSVLKSLASRSNEDREINLERQFFLSCSAFPSKL